MPYIGKSPTGSGVRQRYVYTATGGETSLSGADDNSKVLKFTDGEYVDVYLNGILLIQGSDYGVGTANTISSLAALAANDVVEIIVYDVYNVAKFSSEGLRNRWYYTATGGETSITTTQISTLVFPANADIDVKLNGVTLQAGIDYNTNSANTIGGLSALTAGQVVEIVYYEKFVLSDTVSKASGGTFAKAISVNGDLTVDTDTLHVDASNNQVGVGLTSNLANSKFQVKVDTNENLYFGHVSSQPYMGFINDAGSSWVTGSIAGNPLILRSGQYATEVARVTTNGITFNGDTAAANALDDYEEGSWTPTVTTSSSVTIHSALYTKVGREVSLQAYIGWSNNQNNDSSTFKIEGFPFSTVSLLNTYSAGSIGYVAAANMNDALLISFGNGGTGLYMHQNDGNGNVLKNSEITSRGLVALIFQITYKTD